MRRSGKPAARSFLRRNRCRLKFRIERLASLLTISRDEAVKTLAKIDREQQAFFRKAYGKKGAPAAEFDLVFNFDQLTDSHLAADIVGRCYRKKFRDELE